MGQKISIEKEKQQIMQLERERERLRIDIMKQYFEVYKINIKRLLLQVDQIDQINNSILYSIEPPQIEFDNDNNDSRIHHAASPPSPPSPPIVVKDDFGNTKMTSIFVYTRNDSTKVKGLVEVRFLQQTLDISAIRFVTSEYYYDPFSFDTLQYLLNLTKRTTIANDDRAIPPFVVYDVTKLLNFLNTVKVDGHGHKQDQDKVDPLKLEDLLTPQQFFYPSSVKNRTTESPTSNTFPTGGR